MGTQIHRMTMGQRFRLYELVKADYATSNMSDKEFAVHATTTLGYKCLDYTVGEACKELGIPSKLDVARKTAQTSVAIQL